MFGVTELTPYGLLRKVKSVTNEGNQVTVETTQSTEPNNEPQLSNSSISPSFFDVVNGNPRSFLLAGTGCGFRYWINRASGAILPEIKTSHNKSLHLTANSSALFEMLCPASK